MSKNILLLSPQKFKDRSNALDNIDDKFIQPQIKYAQDVYIEPILGTKFFRGLQTRIDTDTLTVSEQALLDDYIHDALIYFTLSEIVFTTSIKLNPKGVMQKSSDNAVLPSIKELEMLSQTYKNKAEIYLSRLVGHLVQNAIDYDEYVHPEANRESMNPSRSAFKTSFYLGDGDDTCYGCSDPLHCDRCRNK